MNPFVLTLPKNPPALARLRRITLPVAVPILITLALVAGAQPAFAQDPVRTGTTLRNLNLRTAPNLESSVIVTLPDGADFNLMESSGEWIRVRATSGQEGWLYSPFVRLDPPRAAGVTGPARPSAPSESAWTGVTLDSLNLRSGPSTTYSRIVLLPPRMRLEVLEQRGDWLRIRANGNQGWVAGEFVRITSEPEIDTSTPVSTAPITSVATQTVEPPEEPVRISSPGPDAGQRIRELTTENSRLATELAESTARLVQADRERASLRTERDDLRSSLEALQTELTATRSALVEAAQATGENSDAQSELSAVRARLDQSQTRIETLEGQISELQDSRDELRQELESSASRAQQAEAAVEVERARQTQLQQQLQQATSARDEATARITTLTGRIQELESDKETTDSAGSELRAELDRIRTERELADAEVRRLGSELERARAGTAQAEARAATLQGEVDTLRTAAQSQASEGEQLEQARQDLNRLIAERASQEETLVEASAREDQLRDQLRSVGAELDAARLDVNRAVVALEELQAENERLRSDLETRAASTTPPPTLQTSANSTDFQEAANAGPMMPFEPLVPADVEQAEPGLQTEDLQSAELQSEGLQSESGNAAPETVENTVLQPMPVAAETQLDPEPSRAMEAPAEPIDPVVAATGRVEAWRAAWSAADVDGYLNSYVDGYQPDPSTTHASWRTLRRQRLMAPSFIEVRLGTLQVLESGEDRVVLRFEQVYESNTFSDRVMKTLTLVRTEDGDWRIATELASGN